MITIIFAPPRTGKTAFMTFLANQQAFNRERNRAMACEIISKKINGFNNLTIPIHCVSANYDMIFKKFRYSPRYNRRINPYRLGFNNKFVKVHFNFPYEVICITEAQKYLNSHFSLRFPDWQSRWYEQHGHNNLDIYLDTQRPMLINANVRELASFIEIIKLSVCRNKYGKIVGLNWLIRKIENSSLFDRYMASGKKDKDCYTEETVAADLNIFECYDSQSCKPKFYDGHFEEDFDYKESELPDETIDGYIKYLQENDDELPKNFYLTPSEMKKEKEIS
ncbi:MAG: hypothetical protein IJW32_01950 [Clostridia bacterium]|nr:hypothetical protein [Clostridia bacterium]